MATVIGEFVAKIGADMGGFTKGVDKADKKMGSFAKNFAKHRKAIGIGMTAMGGAIVASLALSIKSFAKAGDEIQKMAIKTGFSTVALSELKHAAELGGASLQTVEKAVKRMSKAIVDAGDGMTTYVRAFDRIGLSAEELIKLSPEEQFDKIAMAIAAVESPTIRAAAAQDLFGRAGMDLLPMLADGREGLALLREEAHTLGIVFDQEAANKAATFNDALTKLKGGIEGAKMKIADALIPVLIPLIDKITAVIKQVGEWMKANPELTGTIVKVAGAVGGLLLILGPLLIILPGLTTAVGLFGAALTLVSGPVGWIIAGIALLTAGVIWLWKNWGKLTGRTKEVIEVMEANADIVDRVVEANDTLVDSLADIADGTEEVTDAVGDMIAKLEFAETTAGRLNISMEDLYGILLRTGTSTERISELYDKFGDDILNVNKLLQEMGLTAEEAQQHLAQFERITRLARRDPVDPMRGLTPFERAKRKRREEAGLPIFHSGGIVPGSPGQNVPIMAEAGEVITPANRGMNTYNITIEGNVWSEDGLMERFREFLLKTGTDNISTGIV